VKRMVVERERQSSLVKWMAVEDGDSVLFTNRMAVEEEDS
jgi:hypothetical protein